MKDRSRTEFEDLQRELAGMGDAKIGRFLPEEEREKRKGRVRGAFKDEVSMTALQLAMQDPDYRVLYEEVGRALSHVQDQVYDALTKSAETLREAEDALQEAKGNGVSDEDIHQYERAAQEARRRDERTHEHDRELAEIQRRMEDRNNPPTAEELERYRERIEEIGTLTQQQHDVSQSQERAFGIAPKSGNTTIHVAKPII